MCGHKQEIDLTMCWHNQEIDLMTWAQSSKQPGEWAQWSNRCVGTINQVTDLTTCGNIVYSKTKFMHSFHFKHLPPSFVNTWSTNIERNPGRALRIANDLYIPPHRVEFIKSLPLFSYPLAWNQVPDDKLNPRQNLYLKIWKKFCRLTFIKLLSFVLFLFSMYNIHTLLPT
jgi:hypothetical protein